MWHFIQRTVLFSSSFHSLLIVLVSTRMTAGPLFEEDDWHDWQPIEQTALDFLSAPRQHQADHGAAGDSHQSGLSCP